MTISQAAPVTVLQLTDPHLLAKAGGTLMGVDTARYFRAVLAKAMLDHPLAELILLTGDLAQEPCPASYRRLLDCLLPLGLPCMCLPGNHDDWALMRAMLAAPPVDCGKLRLLGRWQIIALNSQIPGSAAGALACGELDFLADCLGRHPDHHALVAVHHHCLPSGSPWMDTMMIGNHGALLAVLGRHRPRKVVVGGHIHQQMAAEVGGITVLATPSTCFQFAPASARFKVDDSPPAYRVLRLHADGGLETAVTFLPEPAEGLDNNGHGY